MTGTMKVTYLQEGTSVTTNLALDSSGNVTVGNNLTVSGTGNTSFSGNVGIGTSSPTAKVQIYTNGAPAASGNMTTGMAIASAAGSYAINIGADATAGYTWLNSAYINASNTASPMVFMTGAAERMRIDSSGNLLVGATASSSSSRLLVKSSGTTSATLNCVFLNSSNTTLGYIRDDGLWLTGSAAASPYNNTTASAANVAIDSNGVLYRSTSSLRYKTDVQNAPYGLADVLKLRAVTYKGKNDGNKVFGGLIAEEVDAAGLKEFVTYNDEGQPDALAYGNMVSLLVAALQEANAKIDALAAEVEVLKSKTGV